MLSLLRGFLKGSANTIQINVTVRNRQTIHAQSLAPRTRDRVVILMRDNDTWNESPVIEFPDTEELEHIGQQARPPPQTLSEAVN